MQDMAKTPSRPRSCPNTEFWLLPLTEDIFRTRVSQPKRAKWKMVVRRDGVMLVDKGIQLKRCARHSSAREHIYSLSVSRMGIGWFNNLAALGLCNRLLNRSPRKQSRHLRYESRQLPSNGATTNPSYKAKGIRASGTQQVSVQRFIWDELVIFVSWSFRNFYSDNSNAMGCILGIHYKTYSPPWNFCRMMRYNAQMLILYTEGEVGAHDLPWDEYCSPCPNAGYTSLHCVSPSICPEMRKIFLWVFSCTYFPIFWPSRCHQQASLALYWALFQGLRVCPWAQPPPLLHRWPPPHRGERK